MPTTEWETSYPGAQDTVGDEQPDLINDSSPGAADGDIVLVSQIHALRDKVQALADFVGDENNLPLGSLRDLIGGSSGGFQTALNEDYTSLANLDLDDAGDGDKTINGKTAYADNMANTDDCAVVNGSGLKFDHDGTNTLIFNNTHSGPIVGYRLASLGIKYPNVSIVRAWGMFTHNLATQTGSTFGERLLIGFEKKRGSGFDASDYWMWSGSLQYNVASGPGLWWIVQSNRKGSGATETNNGNTAHDVMMVQLHIPSWTAFIFTGASNSGAFPEIDDLELRGISAPLVGGGDVEIMKMPIDELAAFMGCDTQNTDNDLLIHFKKFKIEYK